MDQSVPFPPTKEGGGKHGERGGGGGCSPLPPRPTVRSVLHRLPFSISLGLKMNNVKTVAKERKITDNVTPKLSNFSLKKRRITDIFVGWVLHAEYGENSSDFLFSRRSS